MTGSIAERSSAPKPAPTKSRSMRRGRAGRWSARARVSSAPVRARRSSSIPRCTRAPLRRIAEETGGRFYTADAAQGLAEDIRYAGRGVTSVEERELWNMPIILIALMGLVCAEWGYRRLVGLA